MLVGDFVKHLLSAKTLHGTHSPFVYSLYNEVFNQDIKLEKYIKIEQQRKKLKSDDSRVQFTDYGAKGTQDGIEKKVRISTIAQRSLKSPKWGRAMYRLLSYLEVSDVIELGTSLGITTSYLALPSRVKQVTTFEGAKEVARCARKTWEDLGLTKISVIEGNIDCTLLPFLEGKGEVEFAFVDANHQEKATKDYFETILPYCSENSVLVFDDIYWSKGMKNAWEYIKSHPKTLQTLDLYEIGIVFFRQNQSKEHFKLKY